MTNADIINLIEYTWTRRCDVHRHTQETALHSHLAIILIDTVRSLGSVQWVFTYHIGSKLFHKLHFNMHCRLSSGVAADGLQT